MSEHVENESEPLPLSEYEIASTGGVYAAKFNSPYNSIHRMNGFKTEDDALAWIAEAKLLMRTYG